MMFLLKLQQRFITVVKVQPGLATAHAKLPTHMLGLLNHTLGAHRPNRQSETPSSLLGAIKLWYIVPELLHSHDSRVKRRERFAYIESGDITFILPWLMEYTSQASTRRREPTYKTTDAAKHERASSACRQSGGMSVAAGSFLAEPRAPGDKVTWERVKAKFPGEDRASVSESATEAVAASSTEPEEVSVSNWRPEKEFDSQVALDVINSRNALSGAGSDGLRFSHLQSIIRTGFGREKFEVGIEAFWRGIFDDPGAFPPALW